MKSDYSYEEYKVLESNKNLKKVVGIIIFILFLSYLSGIKLLDIMINYQERKQLVFFYVLFKIIAVFYLFIFFHELGHLTIVKFYGYKLKLFIVGPLVFINDNNNLKLRFKITNLITSGLVMIDINAAIASEYDLSKFIIDFKKISLGGILFNIILIFTGIYMMLFKSTIDIGFIILVINITTVVACTFPQGDISRVIELNKEQNSIFTYFIEELVINYEINEFCKNSIYSYVNNMLISRKYNFCLLNALIQILDFSFINNESISIEIHRFISWFTFNYNRIKDTQNIYIRITATKLMHSIINHNLIIENLLKELNINVDYKNLRTHPLNKVYIEFESYRKKQLILRDIQKKLI